MIAYLRDIGVNYYWVAESFETSCPWTNVFSLTKNVDKSIRDECKRQGVPEEFVWTSFRVTQLYETGACVYVYFGFNYSGVKDPLGAYDAVETIAREEVIKNGGCISHHHGIGKLRKKFVPLVMNDVSIKMIQEFKKKVDPKNIFAVSNTVDFNYDN